jgi:heme exporter protein A
MTALLSFENLAIARGDHVLLRDLTGAVQAGEILHIRGANGVGKTSLLEVLGGLREPEHGEVTRAIEPAACHWIGHRNGLSPALSPFENLRFWCDVQEVSTENVRGALREFDLQRLADHPCGQLSAGQKRRVALARLAVVRRSFWFLDEPLSGLDDAGIRHWLGLLQEHQQHGGAAVVTSHQPLPGHLAGLRALELVPGHGSRGPA